MEMVFRTGDKKIYKIIKLRKGCDFALPYKNMSGLDSASIFF